jgi:hypothetical protein
MGQQRDSLAVARRQMLQAGQSTCEFRILVPVNVHAQVGDQWQGAPDTRLDQIALHAGVPDSPCSTHAITNPVALWGHGLQTIHVDELHARERTDGWIGVARHGDVIADLQ